MPPAGGKTTPPIFFPEKENGRCDRPKERRFPLQASSSKSCNACRLHYPARGGAALALQDDLACSYYPLLRSVCSSSSLRPAMLGVEGSSPRVLLGVQGVLPSRSLGGSRGPFSHVREWPPYCALPHAAGKPKTQPLRAAPPSAPAGCPKPRSRAYVASAEPRSALKSGRNALHSHPSSQRRRTPSPSFTSKVKTTASSVCALTR